MLDYLEHVRFIARAVATLRHEGAVASSFMTGETGIGVMTHELKDQ